MAGDTSLSDQLLNEIKSIHSNNNGVTFHILREYIEKAGLDPKIEEEISRIQRLDGESSQFKTDASEVQDGNISLAKITHEEEELIKHLSAAGDSLLSIYQQMENADGEKKRILKIILLECVFYFWVGYNYIKHGVTIITSITENKSFKKAFNSAGKKYEGIELGVKLANAYNVDQDYERNGGMFNRFNN